MHALLEHASYLRQQLRGRWRNQLNFALIVYKMLSTELRREMDSEFIRLGYDHFLANDLTITTKSATIMWNAVIVDIHALRSYCAFNDDLHNFVDMFYELDGAHLFDGMRCFCCMRSKTCLNMDLSKSPFGSGYEFAKIFICKECYDLLDARGPEPLDAHCDRYYYQNGLKYMFIRDNSVCIVAARAVAAIAIPQLTCDGDWLINKIICDFQSAVWITLSNMLDSDICRVIIALIHRLNR